MTPPMAAPGSAESSQRDTAPPAVLVIFGAKGDLTKRLIVPALYNLLRAGRLPDAFTIVGIDHNDLTTESWRQSLKEAMQSLAIRGPKPDRSIRKPGAGSSIGCIIFGAISKARRRFTGLSRC